MAIAKEKFKVYKNVFDEFTLRTLFKLSSQGHFDEIESPISIGKEANVFTATKGEGRVILKIYRLTACDFTRMQEYLKFDPRFEKLPKKRRQIVLLWVQREFHNLKLAEQVVRVPKPIACLNDVVVMEMIGAPASKIKDQRPKNPKEFLEECIESIRKLYELGYVHADLSSFNILNEDEHPALIDFSQCTPLRNPNAYDFLKRDLKNVCSFFKVSESERQKIVDTFKRR